VLFGGKKGIGEYRPYHITSGSTEKEERTDDLSTMQYWSVGRVGTVLTEHSGGRVYCSTRLFLRGVQRGKGDG
jgi:hypothetical protein